MTTTPTHAMPTSPRLERLLNAAARIDQEITLERAAIARLTVLERDCYQATEHTDRELRALVQQVVTAIEMTLDVSRVDVFSDAKRADVLTARMVLCWFVRTQTGASYPTLGRVFGRHHTSVMNACKRVAASPRLTEQAGHVMSVLTASQLAYTA